MFPGGGHLMCDVILPYKGMDHPPTRHSTPPVGFYTGYKSYLSYLTVSAAICSAAFLKGDSSVFLGVSSQHQVVDDIIPLQR